MKHTAIRIPESEHAQLVELAKRNERTPAQEIRLAIRAHLAKGEGNR